jgi:hypothetical protein
MSGRVKSMACRRYSVTLLQALEYCKKSQRRTMHMHRSGDGGSAIFSQRLWLTILFVAAMIYNLTGDYSAKP